MGRSYPENSLKDAIKWCIWWIEIYHIEGIIDGHTTYEESLGRVRRSDEGPRAEKNKSGYFMICCLEHDHFIIEFYHSSMI
jgi:hypothetical protein